MSKPADDLEAVRAVIEVIRGFKEGDQQRILRWAAEKLGLASPFGVDAAPTGAATACNQATSSPSSSLGKSDTDEQDIRSFLVSKRPWSDAHFAATVAYYYQFIAPLRERRASIDNDKLQDARREVGRERFKSPRRTLQHAHKLGLLDKADDLGAFSISTVGENLVTRLPLP